MKCRESNRTIIRIWTSSHNKEHPGQDVGHISLEVKGSYMSLWPEGQPNEKKLKAIVEARKAHFMASYEEDLKAEGRPPEVTICLYSLSIDKMTDEFNRLKTETKDWTLLGNNIFLLKGGQHSCASLAYGILTVGEIYALIPDKFSFKFSKAVDPDDLLHAVKAAKRSELADYHETRSYLFQSETPVKDLSLAATPFWNCSRTQVAVGGSIGAAVVASAVAYKLGCEIL